jgi:hypothetical protein
VTDVVAPILAGLLGKIGKLWGKTGSGSVIVYGVYGLCAGIAGFGYATIKMFKKQNADNGGAAGGVAPASKLHVLKGLAASLVQGTRLVLQNRFLRVMFGMGLILDLFSEVLGSSVLPEYVENLVGSQSGGAAAIFGKVPALAAIFRGLTSTPAVLAAVAVIVAAVLAGPLSKLLAKMGIKLRRPLAAPKLVYAIAAIPILCWSIVSLMSTAMGVTGLLVVFASLGSILGSVLIQPICKALAKIGFKSEGSLTIPMGVIAALEVPLFWLMITVPSLWLIVPLYGLQALCSSFINIVLCGLNQSKQAEYTEDQLQKMLSAQSLWGISAVVAALVISQMVLGSVPIATLLLIAAIFTSVYGAAQIAFPWLGLSKAERQRVVTPAPSPLKAPAALTHVYKAVRRG